MKVKDIKVLDEISKDKLEFKVTIDRDYQSTKKMNDVLELLKDEKEVELEFRQHIKRRSLDANSYAWILCNEIAKKIGNTKEFVYQEAIKAVGVFEIVPIKEEAVDRWISAWESKGVGWQSEILRDSKLRGYVNTVNYFGSSVYDSKEFGRLLDEIILEAKELGIETMTPDERTKLVSAMYEEE